MSANKRTGMNRRSLLKTAAAVGTFGPLFQATRGRTQCSGKDERPQPEFRAERSEDHRHPRVHGRVELRLSDHPCRHQPGRLWLG